MSIYVYINSCGKTCITFSTQTRSEEHLMLFQKTRVEVPIAMLGSLQLPVTLFSGDLTPSASLLWHIHSGAHTHN